MKSPRRLYAFRIISCLVIISATSKTAAFHARLGHRQQKLWQRERRRTPACRIPEQKATKLPFRIYAAVQDPGIDDAKQHNGVPKSKTFSEPSFLISRRSATTSMVTTAASIFCSTPAFATEGEATEEIIENITTDKTETVSTDDKPPKEEPIAKEKTIEYKVQDFTMALPANWKIITKYDEKSTKQPSTPTIFSAIDFNSGAVISVVREEPCSVADYAKTSFDKSAKKGKKCDFALKEPENGNPFQTLFSLDTYEKDAAKLLIRHDDRDNAALRAVSKIDDARLVGASGLRRFPLESLAQNDSTRVDSFSSSLLEISATTTIPTSGTYRDTMGLEQPNTIDRRVLAKAVATTTRITETIEDISQTQSKETKLLAENEKAVQEVATDPTTNMGVSTTDGASAVLQSETKSSIPNDATEDKSGEVAVAPGGREETELVVRNSEVESKITEEKATTMASTPMKPKSFDNDLEKNLIITSDTPISSEEKRTSQLSTTSVEDDKKIQSITNTETSTGTTMVSSDATVDAPNSGRAAMLAMLAMEDESTTTESKRKALSTGDIEKAIEASMEKAMETAIEKVKENTIEPTLDAVMQTAKETAKEMALEMLTKNAEEQASDNDKPLTNESAPKGQAVEESLRETLVVASTSDTSAIASETIPPTTVEEPVASASPAASEDISTPIPAPATKITTTTSVLSVWLSAPLDEWQKPAMGTRLNQIWDSVQYTGDIIEGSDRLALLSEDNDDSMSTQLLLMNNKAIR